MMPWPFIAAVVAFASIFLGVALMVVPDPLFDPIGARRDGRRGVVLVAAGIAGLVAVAVGALV